jgi:putative acetyltransferase
MMITIRPETTEDYDAIHRVNFTAFGKENEPHLVETLRQAADAIPELSLVAVVEGQVVGHILFSPITIEIQNGSVPALSLAPLAVLPEFQNQGIGSALVQSGLKECQRLGHGIVIVLGHPGFYPRFGFTPARARGIDSPFNVSDDVWMALELRPGALDSVRGRAKYPPAFDEV